MNDSSTLDFLCKCCSAFNEFEYVETENQWRKKVDELELSNIIAEIANFVPESLDGPIPILLEGDLGSGKTSFVKHLGQFLGINVDLIRSPTFVRLNIYTGRVPVHHFDLYRAKCHDDLEDIEEWMFSDAVICIEWPSLIKKTFPAHGIKSLLVKFSPGTHYDNRIVTFSLL